MTRPALMIAAAAACLVTACGSDPAAAPANKTGILVRSEEQNRLHQLDDPMRDIALKRAIIASGLRCKRVTRSGYVAEYNNLSMWSADCEDQRSWGIFVGPDGSAQVRPCTDMAKFKLPACTIAADPSGRAARGLKKEG